MLPKSIYILSRVKETVCFFYAKRDLQFHEWFRLKGHVCDKRNSNRASLLDKMVGSRDSGGSSLLFFQGSLIFVRSTIFDIVPRETARWRKLTRPSLGISNPISVKFLTDDATWKFSREPASEKFEAILLSKGKRWASTSAPAPVAKFLYTQRQQVRNFACARIPDHRSVSAKLTSRV